MVRLTKREQRFGIIMAAFIAVWVLYGLTIRPACQRIATLERVLPDKQKELDEIQKLSREYLTSRREFAESQSRVARQDPNFELPSFLESLIDQHQLTAHMANMQRSTLQSPSGQAQTVVVISFEGIAMEELAAFQRAIEESDAPTTLGYVHIYHKDRQGRSAGLNAEVQILSPQHNQNTVAADLP